MFLGHLLTLYFHSIVMIYALKIIIKENPDLAAVKMEVVQSANLKKGF